MTSKSLYYPYIHLRNPEWLKATLLLFSQVQRMTPAPGAQVDDDDLIRPFTQRHGGRDPMLVSADLRSERVLKAQDQLARRLSADAQDPDFEARFGMYATVSARSNDDLGFQIHQGKLDNSLKFALNSTRLSWQAGNPEPYGSYAEYVEVNPRVGEAVMSTLAVACAMSAGLDIVGDERSGRLHECLVNKRSEDIYDAWLHKPDEIAAPIHARSIELFEFVIHVACDTTQLSVQALAELDREPLNRLLKALGESAKDIPAMDPGAERTQRFLDETSLILERWRSDRANLSHFWRKFFGVGVLDPGAKFIEKVITNAAQVAPAAGVGVGTAGVLAGLNLHNPLLASAAGLGIGLFTHASKTFADVRTRSMESPYRYLTLMEQAGVVIRTDVHRDFNAS